jgi:AraC family transcriptional regulator
MFDGDQKRAVQRMQDFIDANLTQPITLHQLAVVSSYSPYYAARLFKEITGKAPFDYIRLLRLSGSAMVLRHEPIRIIDVAFDFVFDSHEGFTRAFSKQFGMTPQYFRHYHPPVRLFMPDRIRNLNRIRGKGIPKMNVNMKKENMEEPCNTVFVQVIDRPARRMILKRGIKAEDYFEYCDEVGCDIWNILIEIKNALYEPVGCWLPSNLQEEGTSAYVQGVEVAVDFTGPVPDGFACIDLPPCQMMVFQGPPFQDEQFEEAIGSLWEIMDKYDPKPYGFEWADEAAPRFQLEPQGYRGYIEGRPVRQTDNSPVSIR